jgi:FtsH-binding integral membrane protein
MWRNLRRLSGVTIDLDYWPMKTVTRVISALALSFVVGVILASANGQDTLTALRSSVSFASITAALVALLSFGMEKAEDKGYPGWIGLLLVVFLNVLGLVILTLLPRYAAERTSPSQ